MSKPWDELRPAPKRPPIGNGQWKTSALHAKVIVRNITTTRVDLGFHQTGISCSPSTQQFSATDLSELIEFLKELRDQLESSNA